jgi:hypothetical protein
MAVIGSIVRPDDPKVSAATWREVVAAFGLSPIASCEIVNPFSGKPDTLRTPGELAAAAVDGRPAGVLRWCSRGNGIDVFGDRRPMGRVARAIAAHIGGEFEEEPGPD